MSAGAACEPRNESHFSGVPESNVRNGDETQPSGAAAAALREPPRLEPGSAAVRGVSAGMPAAPLSVRRGAAGAGGA